MSVRNAQGESVDQGLTKVPDVPNAPTIGTATDVGLNQPYNNGAVKVYFTPTGYWESTFTATSTPGSFTGTDVSSPVTVTGLASQTAYTFTVKGNNAQNNSGPNSSSSISVTATTVPQEPTITGYTDGNTGISGSISFTAGATGGKLISNYKYSLDGINYTSAATTSSPINITGLTVGNNTVYLKAVNANGDSAASAAFTAVVPPPPVFDSIATATGTGSSSTISFTSIPSTYKSLQIRFIAKTTSTALTTYNLGITFNSDSTTNYAYHKFNGDGTNVVASGTASTSSISITSVLMDSDAGNDNRMTVGILDIYDYTSTTKNKTARLFLGQNNNNNSNGGTIVLGSGLWFKTPEAITRIDITTNGAGNFFTTSTQFALYGMK